MDGSSAVFQATPGDITKMRKNMNAFKITFLLSGIFALLLASHSGEAGDKNGTAPSGKNNSYTVKALIAMALNNYGLLKASREEITIYRHRQEQAASWENTELSASGGFKKDTSGGYLYGLSLSQSIPWSGKKSALMAVSKHDEEIAAQKHREMKLYIHHEVTRLAYRYRALREMVLHTDDRLKRLRLIGTYLKNRNIISPDKIVEKNIILGRVLTLEKDMLDIERRTREALDHLNTFTSMMTEKGRFPEIEINWNAPVPAIDPGLFLETALKKNCALLAARSSCAREESMLNYEKLKSSPDISISLFYNEENTGFAERSVGGGVSLPLPVLNRNRGGIGAGESQLEIARVNLLYTEREVRRNIKALSGHYGTATRLLKKFNITLMNDIEQQMRYADGEFIRGRVSLQNYLAMDEQSHELLDNLYHSRIFLMDIYTGLHFLAGIETKEESR